jgi:hypothetical protein
METIKCLTYIINMVLPKLYLYHNKRFRLSVASYFIVCREINDHKTQIDMIIDYAKCIDECLNVLISMEGLI